MRAFGTVLMWGGMFFVSVAAAAVLGPALRALGIDIRAETTSVVGSALIGIFAFATGALMRRRVADAERAARALETSEATPRLGSAPAQPIAATQREQDRVP